MTSESITPEALIAETLRRAYGLAVERIAFLTTGWASLIYRAELAGGERYLLKLYDQTMPAPIVAGARDFYLPLSRELCRGGWLPQIACPVPARDGRFAVQAGGWLMTVFHYLEGEPVGFGPLPDDIFARVATLVGRLHASTPHLALANPLVERFAIAFEDSLPAWLAALAGPSPRAGPAGGAHPGWLGFQSVLLPRRAELLGWLARLKSLQAIVKARAQELVICHTDLHGANLLVDPAGELYILDWENAMLAPPEQDLFFFAGDERFWTLFWPNYAREFEGAGLDVDTLAFYMYRRGLEDLADWLQRLFAGVDDDETERRAVHWAGETVDELAGVEARLGRVADRGKPR